MADIRLNLIADLGSFKSALAAAAAEARGTVAQVSIGVDIKSWQKELSEAKRRLRTSLNPNQEIKFKLGPMTALYNSLDSLQKRIENVVKAGDKPVTFDITLDVKNSSVNAAKKLVKDAFSGEYLVPFRVAVADASLTAAKKAVQDSFGAEGFSAAFNVKAISRSINAAKTEVRDAFGADNYKVKFFVAPTTGSLNAAKAAVKEAFSPDNFSVPFGIKLIAGSIKPTQDTIEEALEAFTASFNVAPTTRSINAAKAALKDAFTGESAGDFRPDFNLGNATTASIAEAKAFIATKFEGFKVDFEVEATSGSIRKALAAVKQGFAQVVTKKQDPEAEGGFREIAKDVLVPFKLDPDVPGAQKALLAGFKALRVPFVLDEPGNVAAIAADIAKAIQAAIAAAGVIRPSADLSELIALNEELSRKQAHLARVAADFTGTPIKPLVDTSELDRLSAALEEITAKAARAIAAAQGVVQAQGPGPTAMKLQELVSAKAGTKKSPLRKEGFQYLAKEMGVETGSIAQMQPKLVEKAAGIGEDTARGILKGLLNEQRKVGDALVLIAETAMNETEDFLEIHSPSGKARREIGIPWVDGIIVGVLERIPALKKAVDKLGHELDVRDKVKRLQAQLKPGNEGVGDSLTSATKFTNLYSSKERDLLQKKSDQIQRRIAEIQGSGVEPKEFVDGRWRSKTGFTSAGESIGPWRERQRKINLLQNAKDSAGYSVDYWSEKANEDPGREFYAKTRDLYQNRVNQIQRRITELGGTLETPAQPAIEQAIAQPASEATQKVAALTQELKTVQAALQQIAQTAANPNLNEQIRSQIGTAQKRAQDRVKELQGRIAVEQAIPGLPATAIDPSAYEQSLLVQRQVSAGDFNKTLARTPWGRQRQLGENRRLTAENAFATLGLGGTDFEKAADTTAQQKALATLGALQKAGTISAGDYARAQLKVKQATLDAALPLKGLTNSLKELGSQMATAAQDVLLYGAAFQALSVVQQLPGRIYEAVKAQDAFSNTMKASLGTGDTYGQQLAFLSKLSEQYGLNLAESRQGLTKMFAAMRQAGNETQDINNLQESLAILGASFNLNPEQMDRISTALGQISSKGQLMAEELKGQLGDVLPGAVVQFAQAAGYTGPDAIAKFNKAMEAGEISGEKLKTVLRNWSEIVKRDFSSAAAQAGNSLQGMENRFANLTTRIYESFNGPLSEIAPKILAPLVGNLEKTADALDVVFGTSSNRESKLKAQLEILKQASKTGSAPKVGDTVGGKTVTASNLLELGMKEGQAVDVEAIKNQTQQLNDQLGQTQSRLQDLKDDGSVQSLANDFRNAADSVKAFFQGVAGALGPLSGLLGILTQILRFFGGAGPTVASLAGAFTSLVVQARLGIAAFGVLSSAITAFRTVTVASTAATAAQGAAIAATGTAATATTAKADLLTAATVRLNQALMFSARHPVMLAFIALAAAIGNVASVSAEAGQKAEEAAKKQKAFNEAINLGRNKPGFAVTDQNGFSNALQKVDEINSQINDAKTSGDSDRVQILEKQRREIEKQASAYQVAISNVGNLTSAERQRLLETSSERVSKAQAELSSIDQDIQSKRQELQDITKEAKGAGGLNILLKPELVTKGLNAEKELNDLQGKRSEALKNILKLRREDAALVEKIRRQEVETQGQDAKRRLAQFFTGALGLSQDNIDKVVQELQARLKTSTPGTKDFAQQIRAIELAKALAEDAGKSVLQKFEEAARVQGDAARQVKQAEIDAAEVRRNAVQEALRDRLTGISEEGQQLLAQVDERKNKEIQAQNNIKKIQLEIAKIQQDAWINAVKQAVLIQSIIESTQLPGLKSANKPELIATAIEPGVRISVGNYKEFTGKTATQQEIDASPALKIETLQKFIQSSQEFTGKDPKFIIDEIAKRFKVPGNAPAWYRRFQSLYQDQVGVPYRTPAEARADAQRRGPGLSQAFRTNLAALEGVDAFRDLRNARTQISADLKTQEIAEQAAGDAFRLLLQSRSPQQKLRTQQYTTAERTANESIRERQLQSAITLAPDGAKRQKAKVDLEYWRLSGKVIERFRADIKFLEKEILQTSDPSVRAGLKKYIDELNKGINVLSDPVFIRRLREQIQRTTGSEAIGKLMEGIAERWKSIQDGVSDLKAQIVGGMEGTLERVAKELKDLDLDGGDPSLTGLRSAVEKIVLFQEALKGLSSVAGRLPELRETVKNAEEAYQAILRSPMDYEAFKIRKEQADAFGGLTQLTELEKLVERLGVDTQISGLDEARLKAAGFSPDEIKRLKEVLSIIGSEAKTLGEALGTLKQHVLDAAEATRQNAFIEGLGQQYKANRSTQADIDAALGRISPAEAEIRKKEIESGTLMNPEVRQRYLDALNAAEQARKQMEMAQMLGTQFEQGLTTAFDSLANEIDIFFGKAREEGQSFWTDMQKAASDFFMNVGKELQKDFIQGAATWLKRNVMEGIQGIGSWFTSGGQPQADEQGRVMQQLEPVAGAAGGLIPNGVLSGVPGFGQGAGPFQDILGIFGLDNNGDNSLPGAAANLNKAAQALLQYVGSKQLQGGVQLLSGGGGGGGFNPLGLLGGIFGAFGGGFGSTSFGSFNLMGGVMNGTGGLYANGGIARGGFRAFATGGIVSQPTLGLVGEGRYNEAVIPLPDGRSVPVQLSGGGAGNAVTTNITVNVSNGQMQTEGGAGGNNLSRKLEAAVKQVIANELRPGGLIPGGRR